MSSGGLGIVALAVIPAAAAQLLSVPALANAVGLNGLSEFLALTSLAPWLALSAFGFDQRARSASSTHAVITLAGSSVPLGLGITVAMTLAAPWIMALLYEGWNQPFAATVFFCVASLAGVFAPGREALNAQGRAILAVGAFAFANTLVLTAIWLGYALLFPFTYFALAAILPYAMSWAWCSRRSGYRPATRLPNLVHILSEARKAVPYVLQSAGTVALLSFDVIAFVPGRGAEGTAYALYSKVSLLAGMAGMALLAHKTQGIRQVETGRTLATVMTILIHWASLAAVFAIGAWLFGDPLFEGLAGLPQGYFGLSAALAMFGLLCCRGATEILMLAAAAQARPVVSMSMSLAAIVGVGLMFIAGRYYELALAQMILWYAAAWFLPAAFGLARLLHELRRS